MYNRNYIDDCLNGDATIFDLDNYIEYWHTHDMNMTLREFLGMTDYEYEMWGKSSDSMIRDILRCRQENIEYSHYIILSDEERLAARSYNQEAIDKLKEKNKNDK